MGRPSLCFVSPHAYALFSGVPRGFGGAEVQQGLIGRSLAARGFDVRFVSYAPGDAREEHYGGIRVFTVPSPGHGRSGLARKRANLDLWRALARVRPGGMTLRRRPIAPGLQEWTCRTTRAV